MSTYKTSHKARYFISLLGNLCTHHLHGKPGILVGKSSGSLQSIWEASENMGYD